MEGVYHGQASRKFTKCLSAGFALCIFLTHDPLSEGFLRQEYWSGLPFPYPGDLPSPGIEPASPALAGGLFSTEPPGKPNKPILTND